MNAQDQTDYIALIYCECNVFELFLRKIETVVRSDDEIFRSAPLFTPHIADDVEYVLVSCDSLEHRGRLRKNRVCGRDGVSGESIG